MTPMVKRILLLLAVGTVAFMAGLGFSVWQLDSDMPFQSLTEEDRAEQVLSQQERAKRAVNSSEKATR